MTEPVEISNHHAFVVNIFCDEASQTWFATISKDKTRRFQTERFDTKKEAVKDAARLMVYSIP